MKKTKLTLIKSTNRRTENHKSCVRGLGLRGINSSVEVNAADPCIKGMINKVRYLLKVEEA
jgi:large subunit ribosomal protein L30